LELKQLFYTDTLLMLFGCFYLLLFIFGDLTNCINIFNLTTTKINQIFLTPLLRSFHFINELLKLSTACLNSKENLVTSLEILSTAYANLG
jgi:hypothetical protein